MNSQAFTPEQVDNGELRDLIDYLLNFNRKSEKSYMDIHITSDSYCTIVEWTEIHYDFKGECGEFKFVDSDEYVMKEIRFPDGHYDMVYPEEAEQRLKDWHSAHPEWVMTPYGTWTNEEENKKFREELGIEDK